MGYTAELVADKFKITREDMDLFAFNSNKKAIQSIKEGIFKEEILPLEMPQKKGTAVIFDTDEGVREPDLDALRRLQPVFKKDGRVTAGNSSKISDGASALVLMSKSKAKRLGIAPMATVVAQASAGVPLEDVLVAPIKAIPKVLAKAGLKINDIDLFEINEAFAASTVAVIRELGLDEDKVNVHGGAVALGHPIGCSGARLLTTLLYAMKRQGVKRGIASLCLGGGEAVSLIVER
jgi:acetyl-CoA C-acetyltransferase